MVVPLNLFVNMWIYNTGYCIIINGAYLKMHVGKKVLAALIITVAAGIALTLFSIKYYSGRKSEFRTRGASFEILKDGKWQDFLIKGVNMGAAKPGCFPGEMGITKSEYMRWFKQIAEMNANTIRVYTILGPDFYEAFYEYNIYTRKPLYLFHGVWMNEEAVSKYRDAYHPDITGEIKSEIADLIDLLHGNKTIKPRPGHASGAYNWDVSPYVAGYILGIELDAAFVINTNKNNPQVSGFDGSFLYTKNASPHESWLAEIGDYAIGYEYGKYKTQKALSWTNWITTDPLWHHSEPDRHMEDAVSVDIEHILKKDSFKPGLFASYHIYPYYPEFMMFDPVYTAYIDGRGKINPYEAYLKDIKKHHSVPLLVAEFGVPTSRGRTHENILTHYDQGGLSEEKAGEYAADMFDSIVEAGCAGGMIFTWQDEWSKRSWNTMDYDIPERRAFWSNPQVSEQCYGILAFDPGKRKPASHTDGDISEWNLVKHLTQKNGLTLHVMSDVKYVYFMIQDDEGNTGKNKYTIAVSGLKDQGNLSFNKENLKFQNPAGECIIIDGKDNSRILVDAYYDVFYRQYSLLGYLGIIERNKLFERNNSGIFNPVNLVLRRALDFPLTRKHLAPSFYETGKLTHGNSNPEAEDYNSLADFFISPGSRSIELRIPWQLLNVADPSTKTVIGNLYTSEKFSLNPVKIEGFTFELIRINENGITSGGSGFYSWKPWETVQYHERLKKSYDIIRGEYAKY